MYWQITNTVLNLKHSHIIIFCKITFNLQGWGESFFLLSFQNRSPYWEHKLNISARIPLPTNLAICLQPSRSNPLASTRNTFPKQNLSSTKPQPQLSKTVTLQTSFPEACPVCSKYQCEVDFKHSLVQQMGEALDKTFKDLKVKTDKQIVKYSTDLEQEL